MRKMIAAAALVAGLAMLGGCGGGKDGGGLTAEENDELNNAAEMLDASPDSLVANDEAVLGNGEEDGVATGEAPAANEAGNAAGNGR